MDELSKYTERQRIAIINDAYRSVTMARAHLTRLSKYMFYATILHGARLTITNNVNGEAIDTMATDSVDIFANPLFVLNIPPPEVMGVLAHEVLHIADLHNYRMGNRVHAVWARACDFAINPIIMQSGLRLPAGGLFNPAYQNKSAEQIYNEEYKINPTGSSAPQLSNSGKPLPGPGKILPPPPKASKEGRKEEIKQQVIITQRICQAGGITIPQGIDKIGAQAKKPSSRWQEQLREFVSQSIITPAYTTWSRPNRRLLSQGIYMPGWHKEDQGHLVIAKDTSGSINSAPNAQFDKEIFRILEDVRPSKITIIACDTVIRYCETFEGDIPQRLPSNGGGGTSFTPVIDYVNNMMEKPSGLVYFTDLLCHSFGEPSGYPVLWAKWGHGEISAPYGKTINING